MAATTRGLGVDFEWLVGWSISLFILSETYSIIANVYTFRTGQEIAEFDAVSMILRRIRAILEGFDSRS